MIIKIKEPLDETYASGEYPATITGYSITFTYADEPCKATSLDTGVRGIGIPCVVRISPGNCECIV